MSRVYVLPVKDLSYENMRKIFKKAKQDAKGDRGKDVQQVPREETPE